MSKVLITRSKLDGLATTIAAKSGATLPLTIAQMDAAVDGIVVGSGTDTSHDTVDAAHLLDGYTAHDSTGTAITGTYVPPTFTTQSKTATPTTSQQTVEPDAGYDGLSNVTVNAIPSEYIVPSGTKSITANGTGIDVTSYASVDVNVPDNDFIVTLSYNEQTEMWEPDCTYAEIAAAAQDGKVITANGNPDGRDIAADGAWYDDEGVWVFGYTVFEFVYNNPERMTQTIYGLSPNGLRVVDVATISVPSLQSKSATPTESTQTITADSGYDGLSSVSVGAISSTYVGTGIDQRSSTDLTASGATVTVPSGYYESQASKAVASGTAGTPTATKGSVSNHSVSVTPSVTNTTGYITGGTKTGTAVTVSASELVSGTLSITSSGTTDVTNYASASVAAGGATASATKGTVSNHSVTVTPSVTRTAGYVTAGSSNGTAVTVSASELVSGTYTVDSSGTKDVTNYASASVPSGSATASATKGSVSNHSVSVTPSVARTAGWVSAGTASGMAVTVSASELVSGSETKTANGTYDVTNLASLIVDVDGYTLTTVCPEQTITPNSDRLAYPVGSFDYEVGEFYLVTFDGVEYVTSCALCWETNHVIGDTRVIWNDAVTVVPFCAITTSVTDKEVYCRDTNTHTIKVEHLELGTPAAVLTTKTITSNGTYNASSDNADGYSSVTVNVPSGGGTYQAKTNISPTTSSQTIRPDSGYDALSSVQINAMPSGTAGTPSATKGSVSNHAVSVTPSVTNSTGYITGGTKTGTAVTVSASELVSGSETKTANGTYDVTNLASLVVSIPIVTYHTSSSAPTSSQGSDGDLWLVTA